MGLRAFTPDGVIRAGFGYAGNFNSSICKRYYPTSYKISGITRPGYFGFDPNLQAWVPSTINNISVTNSGGCLPINQLSWSATDLIGGGLIELRYVQQGNAIVPSSSWIIKKVFVSTETYVAYAVGSKWNPPRSGYTMLNGYAGSPIVR